MLTTQQKIFRFIRRLLVGGLLIAFYAMAFNSYQEAQTSKAERIKADEALTRESRKTSNIIDHNSNEVVYLAPKGSTSKNDENADVIDQLVKKTFKYSSPKAFYNQAKYVENRVEGPFYKYWFGKSIKDSYETLNLKARGSTLKRNYKNYVLVKKGNLHYFAVISTYTKLGFDTDSTPNSQTYALDFVWNNQTSRWHVTALPNVNMQ